MDVPKVGRSSPGFAATVRFAAESFCSWPFVSRVRARRRSLESDSLIVVQRLVTLVAPPGPQYMRIAGCSSALCDCWNVLPLLRAGTSKRQGLKLDRTCTSIGPLVPFYLEPPTRNEAMNQVAVVVPF